MASAQSARASHAQRTTAGFLRSVLVPKRDNVSFSCWTNCPVELRIFRFHKFTVMLEDHCRRIAHFQRELSGVVEMGYVVGAKAMAQSVLWPFCAELC